MRGSWYPWGWSDYSDREDSLAQAEVGRLVLDNSRDSDGRMRRNNGGYFAEIAPMAGVRGAGLGFVSAAYRMPDVVVPEYVDPATSPYGRAERYSTAEPVGPTGPIMLPAVTGGNRSQYVTSPYPTGGGSTQAIMRLGDRLPSWALPAMGVAGLAVVGLFIFGASGGRKPHARRRRR